MARLGDGVATDMATYHYDFTIELDKGEDRDRAERILRAAVLTINDKVGALYEGQAAPPRTSELERGNYA